MSNSYWNHSGYPANSEDAQAIDVRAELLAIQSGFDKLPAFAGQGDRLVLVKASETGLQAMATGKFLLNVPWTPVLTCSTPGNLTIAYSRQIGVIHRVGPLILIQFDIQTSTFTHTTASGEIRITGLPITAINLGVFPGAFIYQGITKASFTQFAPVLGSSSQEILIEACGSGQTKVSLVITELPTAGSVRLQGSLLYFGNG